MNRDFEDIIKSAWGGILGDIIKMAFGSLMAALGLWLVVIVACTR